MRTNPLVTVIALVFASTGAIYYMLQDNAPPKQVEAAKPFSSSTSDPPVQNPPLREERRNQPTNLEQQQLTQMREKIADLESRLRYMETTAREQINDQTVSRPEEPVVNEGTEKAKTKKLSEEDFGHWLDDALVMGAFDGNATKLTMEEMEMSLAEVPGINLADLQCGGRFCRASFASDNGKPPNITQLIGASPFIEAGFTIHEPDGGVRVYFTQPGQSFRDLRSEAQESALSEMPPR